jgi:hypothetical protein
MRVEWGKCRQGTSEGAPVNLSRKKQGPAAESEKTVAAVVIIIFAIRTGKPEFDSSSRNRGTIFC